MTLRDQQIKRLIAFWRSRTFFEKLLFWIFHPICASEFSALDRADRKTSRDLVSKIFKNKD